MKRFKKHLVLPLFLALQISATLHAADETTLLNQLSVINRNAAPSPSTQEEVPTFKEPKVSRVYGEVMGDYRIYVPQKTDLGLINLNAGGFQIVQELPRNFDESFDMGGGGIRFGYILLPGENGALGKDFRLEFQGSSSYGEADSSYAYDSQGVDTVTALRLDGSGTVDLENANELTTRRDVERTHIDIALNAKTDYAFSTGAFTATPLAGIRLIHENQDNRFTTAGNLQGMSVKETIESYQVGPQVGFRVSCEVAKDMEIYVEPTAALLVSANQYKGAQSFTNASANSVKDTELEIAPRFALTLGWRKHFGSFVLGVEGGAEYLINTAAVEYSSIAPGDSALGTATAGTFLDAQDAYAGFMRLVLGYKF
ncbi:MAG: hypothetical protein SH807_00550 [Blastochloris sp.]|nr:hypothetical protein [Blastochloris sp.]